MNFIKTLLATTAIVFSFSANAAELDKQYQPYKPVSGVSGTLKSMGSDSLNNLMTLWAEDFRKQYPSVQIEIEGKGSSTAPPALIAGTAQFGPMSRPMKGAEVDSFEQKYGYKPSAFRVAVDTLAVYVHKDNPVTCISLAELDGIFSKTRNTGTSNIATWGDLGLTGQFKNQPISLFGRNSASGTYGYFKEAALAGGDYKDNVKEQPGSSAVVQGVGADKFAIGYSGIGYKTADVKVVQISGRDGKCVAPTQEKAYSGEYPITRFMYVYLNKSPSDSLPPLQQEFIKFILSRDGQDDTVKDGYYPLPFLIVKKDLTDLGVVP